MNVLKRKGDDKDEANYNNGEAAENVAGTFAEVVGGECEAEETDRADHVGWNRHEVGGCSTISESLDDDGEEDREALGCYAGQDVERQDTPELPVDDAFQNVALRQLFSTVEIRGCVDHHASVGVTSLGFAEEPSMTWGWRKPERRDERDDNGK